MIEKTFQKQQLIDTQHYIQMILIIPTLIYINSEALNKITRLMTGIIMKCSRTIVIVWNEKRKELVVNRLCR